MTDPFLLSRLDGMEDFWRRKLLASPHRLEYEAYGHPVQLVTNAPAVLGAAHISAGRYSRSTSVDEAGTINLTVIHDSGLPPKPIPKDWPTRLRYLAVGDWLMIARDPWVKGVMDVEAMRGAAWISTSLMAAPYFLSRYVLDTMTLNALIHTGVGQLHASCLYREGRAVLLSAPHNTGKSTTAFRLVLHGYEMLSDGMSYVRVTDRGPELMGYPVGEVKLRLDVLDEFPELQGQGRSLLVREDRKMIFNLRRAMPRRVRKESVFPEEVVIVLLERGADAATEAEVIDEETALAGLWQDAAHYDDLEVLASNLTALRALLAGARCYRLSMGSDGEGLVRTIDGLEGDGTVERTPSLS